METIQSREDLQKYLLASSEIAQNIQEEIDLVVVLRRQNPSENPIIGSLLGEIESGKLTENL